MSDTTIPSRAASPSLRRLASARSISALMLREMATSYGRSPGGYLWAVLEPVAGIALLTLIFSTGFQSPSLGVNFPIFYATGLVPFLLFTDVSGKVALSLLYSKPLLAYPAITFVDALAARFLVNLFTQFFVAHAVLIGIMVLFDTHLTPDVAIVAEAMAYAALLALGVGVFNAFAFCRFPVWQRAWSILTRPLFIISGIFFTFETIPRPYGEALWFNPLIHVVGLMRQGFYAGYEAEYVSRIYLTLLPLGLMTLGLVFLRRDHRDILNNS
ncbi:ABC transporter permease [Roseovarius phycicola]|uniref:Transport permease protein n=1 Tax=Roseovarius phycicola TaxID=3080976 RepID=A0ABZ2HH01_9RHOB